MRLIQEDVFQRVLEGGQPRNCRAQTEFGCEVCCFEALSVRVLRLQGCVRFRVFGLRVFQGSRCKALNPKP